MWMEHYRRKNWTFDQFWGRYGVKFSSHPRPSKPSRQTSPFLQRVRIARNADRSYGLSVCPSVCHVPVFCPDE